MRCDFCGDQLRQKWNRKSSSYNRARFCGRKCRRAFWRRQSMTETLKDSEAQVLAKAKRGADYIIERQSRGKKWFRSIHAVELEAAGLPPNCEIAAISLGISPITLKKRLQNGTDLLAPLRTDHRNGRESLVRLKVLFPELISKIIIYNCSEKRRLKRRVAKVRAEAAKFKKMEV